MKLNITTYLMCLLFCTISIQAFTQQPSQILSFDVDSIRQYKNLNDSALFRHLDHGIKNQALLLNAHEKQYLKLPHTPSETAFSISFWFQIADSQSYPLIYQTQSDSKDKVQKYIELGINNNKIYMKDNHITYPIKKTTYKSQEWHLLNYVFDGDNHIQCFIDGKLVAANYPITLCKKRSDYTNAIFVAKGYTPPQKLDNNYLHGAIDELQITEYGLDSIEVEQMYHAHLAQKSNTTIFPIHPPFKTIQPNFTIVKPKFKNTKIERQSKEQKAIQVNSHQLKLELWDYDEYDEDKISVYLNDDMLPYQKLENILLPKKRRKVCHNVILTPNETNTLTFFATDLGTWYVQNTIGLVVYEINKKGKKKMVNKKDEEGHIIPYKLVCTDQENAVLKIIQQPKEENYCQTIDLGKTIETEVVLQITSKDTNLLDAMQIDDKQDTNFKINKIERNKNEILYTLQLMSNNFHIIPIAITSADMPINNSAFYIKLKKNQDSQLKDKYIYRANRPFALNNNSKLNLQLRHEQKTPVHTVVPSSSAADKTVSLANYQDVTDFELRIQDVLRKRNTKIVIMFDDKVITDTISLKRKQTILLPQIASTKKESHIKIIPISVGKQMTIDAKIVTRDKGKFIEDFKLTIKETKEPTILAIKR